ncbi:hypothetical protein BS17DRAFT_788792 [Gyrodon lividus]|nr:hypothetical protein BS17DRAFT_788792 [Gyrodon lividus]
MKHWFCGFVFAPPTPSLTTFCPPNSGTSRDDSLHGPRVEPLDVMGQSCRRPDDLTSRYSRMTFNKSQAGRHSAPQCTLKHYFSKILRTSVTCLVPPLSRT